MNDDWMQYGLVAVVSSGEVAHFAGYPEQPNVHDVEHLRDELATDLEFELVGVPVIIRPADPKEFAYWKTIYQELKDNENYNDEGC